MTKVQVNNSIMIVLQDFQMSLYVKGLPYRECHGVALWDTCTRETDKTRGVSRQVFFLLKSPTHVETCGDACIDFWVS